MIFVRKLKRGQVYIASTYEYKMYNEAQKRIFINLYWDNILYILDITKLSNQPAIIYSYECDGRMKGILKTYRDRGYDIKMFFKTRDKVILNIAHSIFSLVIA